MSPKDPVASFFSDLKDPRRSELRTLDRLVRKEAPKLEPYAHAGMLAYGRYRYTYPTGRQGEWFKLALSSRKRHISLYVCAMDRGRYLAELFRDRLPRAEVGKSCVRFRTLADVDLRALAELVRRAALAPAPGEAPAAPSSRLSA